MNERTAFRSEEADERSAVLELSLPEVDAVDFASRRAERSKMQLWLTAFTAIAAAAVLLVVSMRVLHAG